MRVAVIPARAGSTRIPGKNWKLFAGRPIIEYSIEAARACGLFDMVVVTTDSPEVKAIAMEFKGLPPVVVLNRLPSLAHDEVGTQEVTKYAIIEIENTFQIRVDIACCVYATAPMISIADLKKALQGLLEMWGGLGGKAGVIEYVYSVGAGMQDAGQFYWGLAGAFLRNLPLEGNSGYFCVDPARVQDINTPEDFAMAERMYTALKEREKNGTH